ncbi:MAG: hypothetical protein IJS37_00660 [Bacilli bacterium]|nr:hypothetical protein [Bacilli bacterium]
MSKHTEPTPDKDARFPKTFSLARTRALKRVIPWVGGVSLVGAGLIAVVAVFAGNGHGFTTKIDRGGDLKDVVLKATRGGGEASVDDDGVYYLNAKGLENAFPTTAEVILPAVANAWNDPEVNMDGSYTFYNDGDQQIGLAYTFYLQNSSAEEKQNYTFYLSLDAYSSPTNAAVSPYAYMRAVVYTSNEDGSEATHTVFAAPNDLGQGTAEGETDTRECISTYSESKKGTIRTPIYLDEGNGYCTNFGPKVEELVRMDETLEPKQVRRYTILTYFEGYDPDCYGSYPENAGITLTAHFGS